MKIDSLMEVLPDSYSGIDRDIILRAYRYAEVAHGEQKRASGEPYVSHCIAVAAILAELHVPPAVVIAGLLHDTVEDTDVTLSDIRKEFGDEVTKLVDGVTKLASLPRVSENMQQPVTIGGEEAVSLPSIKTIEELNIGTATTKGSHHRRDATSETLRKVFLAMGDDIRVVLIKLADRLHNMRTLGYVPEHKRKRIALQTMEIFAPLANRLGIWQIKWELEDLSFRYIEPEKYKEIAENLAERREDRERQIATIIQRVKTVLDNANIKAEISGRPKHIYSIYKKMLEKGRTFEMLRDVRGIRLIVQDISACYQALGIIHMLWRPVPQEFDDYIAGPKDNFYQSLHTAVYYDDGKPLEVQIRTAEMHQDAEYGIAAHWRYKERGRKDDIYEKRINSIRRMMDWRSDVDDAGEFVDSIKSDVLQDRVYAFTPRGDIIDLPLGSTPIDFAYHVHTEIGHRCRGAKANGKLVPLDYELKTGDQIEILTSKQGGPSTDWLNTNLGLVKTQRAKAKIRQWFKLQDREQNLAQGKVLLDREMRRLGVQDVDLAFLAGEFDYRTTDDLYVGIGCGDISLGRIINRLSELEKAKQEQVLLAKPPTDARHTGTAVNVLGLKNILYTFARCCNPAPGDEIVGYITRGRGATIHRQDCPNMLRLSDHERLVKVSWGEPHRTYPVSILVTAYDRQGLMGDISNILANENVNLIDINLKMNHNLANIYLVLEVDDIIQLARVLGRIENLPNVMEARRTKPG